MQRDTQLHRDAPARALYVFHTSRATLDIAERHGRGMRGGGVGGAEFVCIKRLERLSVGELQVSDFDMEVGAMAA